MSRILIVMSAADVWERTDGSKYPTGYWAEELAAPHEAFVRAATPSTSRPPGCAAAAGPAQRRPGDRR